MTAQIQLLYEDSKIPTKGSVESAGYDLYANLNGKEITIAPHTCEKIGTGVAITPPLGYAGWILPRSGMATKRGLRPANTPGLCDWDYTGEYIVALYNDSDEYQKIYDGDRIAQLVFMPYINVDFEEVDELNTTDRGNGGFGHSGIK